MASRLFGATVRAKLRSRSDVAADREPRTASPLAIRTAAQGLLSGSPGRMACAHRAATPPAGRGVPARAALRRSPCETVCRLVRVRSDSRAAALRTSRLAGALFALVNLESVCGTHATVLGRVHPRASASASGLQLSGPPPDRRTASVRRASSLGIPVLEVHATQVTSPLAGNWYLAEKAGVKIRFTERHDRTSE